MHEHLIKWLSDYSKVNCDVRKNGSWHGIKTDILRITYYVLSILILKSVLVFFTFVPISFDGSDLIIAQL